MNRHSKSHDDPDILGCLRALAWSEGFSSAQTTKSPGFEQLPVPSGPRTGRGSGWPSGGIVGRGGRSKSRNSTGRSRRRKATATLSLSLVWSSTERNSSTDSYLAAAPAPRSSSAPKPPIKHSQRADAGFYACLHVPGVSPISTALLLDSPVRSRAQRTKSGAGFVASTSSAVVQSSARSRASSKSRCDQPPRAPGLGRAGISCAKTARLRRSAHDRTQPSSSQAARQVPSGCRAGPARSRTLTAATR